MFYHGQEAEAAVDGEGENPDGEDPNGQLCQSMHKESQELTHTNYMSLFKACHS